MSEEIKKVEASPQAPAKEAPDQKAVVPEQKVVEAPKPTGLDSFTADQLKDFYKRSPQMFEEAGIVPKTEEKKIETPAEKKEAPPAKAASAAPKPKYGDMEINLPEDVQVNREIVDAYLAHAKEIGLNAKQVQSEIDFQTKNAREAAARTPKAPTPEEVDAANVVKLRADAEFGGEKYEESMAIARRAAIKFGDKEVLGKLMTSDPVLVKHFWKLGLADAEDKTERAPNRSGNEADEAENDQQSHLKQRYNHPSSQAMFK